MAKKRVVTGKGWIHVFRGRLLKVFDPEPTSSGMIEVIFVDEDEHRFIHADDVAESEMLGSDPGAVAAFHAAHGIHVRLNRIKP